MPHEATPQSDARTDAWKAAIARLDAAYRAHGVAALERMKGVEPLALWNEKVRDFKAMTERLETAPSVELGQQREVLLREINQIGAWINARQRAQAPGQPRSDRKGPDMDMDR